MLVKFSVKNLFSFNKETEFSMVPGRINRLKHHIYKIEGIDVLKLASIYGTNGAGKSNLIKSILLLKDFVINGNIQSDFLNEKFKLSEASAKALVQLKIEFIKGGKIFYYKIEINDGKVLKEELLYKKPENRKSSLLFIRKSESDESSSINFYDSFYQDNENIVLGSVIEKSLLKSNKSALNLLNTLNNKAFENIKLAFDWFKENIEIISPEAKPLALVHKIDIEPNFKKFACDLISSFGTGVANLHVEKKGIEEFFGKDNKDLPKLKSKLKDNPQGIGIVSDGIIVVNEDGEILTKQLWLQHKNDKNELVKFNMTEESDGTIRLLEYIPLIQEIINEDIVYIVDEIERSIHPLIIKEIVSKFSKDLNTKGQLIFSTHESNLLDQEILRQDEIWFAEKNNKGETDLYPLSNFKEHHTIDIRKGYLNGRYGAIPFLSNLKDLNWVN